MESKVRAEGKVRPELAQSESGGKGKGLATPTFGLAPLSLG
jgi:hypothetical protein